MDNLRHDADENRHRLAKAVPTGASRSLMKIFRIYGSLMEQHPARNQICRNYLGDCVEIALPAYDYWDDGFLPRGSYGKPHPGSKDYGVVRISQGHQTMVGL